MDSAARYLQLRSRDPVRSCYELVSWADLLGRRLAWLVVETLQSAGYYDILTGSGNDEFFAIIGEEIRRREI